MKPFRSNEYGFDEWMEGLVSGKAPDGRKISQVTFLDYDKAHIVKNWREVSVAGHVAMTDVRALGHDAVVEVAAGAILVRRQRYADPEENDSYIIEVCPRE